MAQLSGGHLLLETLSLLLSGLQGRIPGEMPELKSYLPGGPVPRHFSPSAQGQQVLREAGAMVTRGEADSVLEWGQLAAQPAGGAAHAARSSGEPCGLSQKLGSQPGR